MNDPSTHPERVQTTSPTVIYRDPEPPFADRPLDLSIEEFTVSNVPGVHPLDTQYRVVAKIARFDNRDKAQEAEAIIARLLTGEDRISI